MKLGTTLAASILFLVSFQANAEMSFTTDSHLNIVSWDGFYFDEPDGLISSIRGDYLNWPSGNINWKAGAGSWSRKAPVPLPATFWLLGTALIGFIGIARRTSL